MLAEQLLALMVLPLLLPSAHIRAKRKHDGCTTGAYKPSKIEQVQGFLLHLKVG